MRKVCNADFSHAGECKPNLFGLNTGILYLDLNARQSGRMGVSMNCIAAVDSNWAIGCHGSLLVRIPRDQELFRKMTEGKVVVMGRRTLESLPQGKPLSNRENIVLSRDKQYMVKGAVTVHSVEQLIEKLQQYRTEEIFVAGGESVYCQLLPYCDVAYITKIDYVYQADAYFPRLDALPEWKCVAESEEQTYFDLEYYFLKYEKRPVDF